MRAIESEEIVTFSSMQFLFAEGTKLFRTVKITRDIFPDSISDNYLTTELRIEST